jgi:hypothetical protein
MPLEHRRRALVEERYLIETQRVLARELLDISLMIERSTSAQATLDTVAYCDQVLCEMDALERRIEVVRREGGLVSGDEPGRHHPH